MHLRMFILSVLLLLSCAPLKATRLDGDVIYIEGEEWELLNKPIEWDSTLFVRLMEFLPENHCTSTANWEGYTAHWEVRDDSLYLQHLEVCVYDTLTRECDTLAFFPDSLKALFAPYYKNGRICARWMNGTIRAGRGELVRYEHMGFDRNVETERLMRLRGGGVVEDRTYHNRKQEGLDLEGVHRELVRRFPWDDFPEYKDSFFLFWVRDVRVSPDGRLSDFVLRRFSDRGKRGEELKDTPIGDALRKTLKSIGPWQVLYIHNEVRPVATSFMMNFRKGDDGGQ